jgi:DNA-binding transcriptional regulator PaaX
MKKFLTDKFLEALEETEFITRSIFLPAFHPFEVSLPKILKLQDNFEREWDGGEIKKALKRLTRSQYLRYTKKEDRYFLTSKGIRRVTEIRIRKKIKKDKKTKCKYLVLIFDIPEKDKKSRDLFRRKLRELGFKMIQQSVWAIQKDILKEIKILINLYKVKDCVKIFIAEKVV